MAFRAVSAPMLRSVPGTLLDTVAGTMTMGTQSSSYFPRAVNNSSRDRKACRAEPGALVVSAGSKVLLATRRGAKVGGAKGRGRVYHNGQQRNRQEALHIHPQINTGTLSCERLHGLREMAEKSRFHSSERKIITSSPVASLFAPILNKARFQKSREAK